MGKSTNIADKFNKWLSKSPKLEKFVDNVGYYVKHPDKFADKANQFYSRATNKVEHNTIADFAGKLKSFYVMCKMTLNGEYKGISKFQLTLVLLAFIYIISPIDLIPDFLPVIGFVDDAALMIWLIKSASDEVEKFEKWQHPERISPI